MFQEHNSMKNSLIESRINFTKQPLTIYPINNNGKNEEQNEEEKLGNTGNNVKKKFNKNISVFLIKRKEIEEVPEGLECFCIQPDQEKKMLLTIKVHSVQLIVNNVQYTFLIDKPGQDSFIYLKILIGTYHAISFTSERKNVKISNKYIDKSPQSCISIRPLRLLEANQKMIMLKLNKNNPPQIKWNLQGNGPQKTQENILKQKRKTRNQNQNSFHQERNQSESLNKIFEVWGKKKKSKDKKKKKQGSRQLKENVQVGSRKKILSNSSFKNLTEMNSYFMMNQRQRKMSLRLKFHSKTVVNNLIENGTNIQSQKNVQNSKTYSKKSIPLI